jgi:hypothetical protein
MGKITGDYNPQLANQQHRNKARNMGRRTKQDNTTSQKTTNNSTESLVKNERNESLLVDSSRMMISMSNDLNEKFKKVLKKELKE